MAMVVCTGAPWSKSRVRRGPKVQPVTVSLSPIALFVNGAMQVVDAQRWTENNFLRWKTFVDSAVSRGTSLLPKASDRGLSMW